MLVISLEWIGNQNGVAWSLLPQLRCHLMCGLNRLYHQLPNVLLERTSRLGFRSSKKGQNPCIRKVKLTLFIDWIWFKFFCLIYVFFIPWIFPIVLKPGSRWEHRARAILKHEGDLIGTRAVVPMLLLGRIIWSLF